MKLYNFVLGIFAGVVSSQAVTQQSVDMRALAMTILFVIFVLFCVFNIDTKAR